MAGSYSHIHQQQPNDGHGISLIGNLSDAGQCIEELYYLIRSIASDKQIKDALDEFYRYKRGEIESGWADDVGGPIPNPHSCALAWIQTQQMMGRE